MRDLKAISQHTDTTVQVKGKVRMDPQTSLNKPKILPWDPARSFRYMCLCDHCWSWVIWTPNQNTSWIGQSLWCAYDLWNLEIKPTDLLRKQRLQQLKNHTKHGIKKKTAILYQMQAMVKIYKREVIRKSSYIIYSAVKVSTNCTILLYHL